MASTCARVFITNFFTARDARATTSPRPAHDDSPLTEAFLLRGCGTHDLRTAAQLHAFLITEESFLRRAAAREAAEGTRGDDPVRSAGAHATSAGVLTSRKRSRGVAGSDVTGEGDVYAELLAALDLWLLTGGCERVCTVSSGAQALRHLFPSLLEQQQQQQLQHVGSADEPLGLRLSTTPTAPQATRCFPTGCAAVDRVLSPPSPRRAGSSAVAAAAAAAGPPPLDQPASLCGGFAGSWVTEVSGEAGTGKTLMVLQTALAYIARKLAARALGEYFVAPHEDDRACESGDARELHVHEEPEGDVFAHRRRSLWAYRAPIAQLLSALHSGEPPSCTTASLTDMLRAARADASGICAVYLVSEEVPSARLASVAAGCARVLVDMLTNFFAALLPATVLGDLVLCLRRALRVEAVLQELRVRAFATLDDLLRLMEGPLRSLVRVLQQPLSPGRSHAPAAGGGILIVDSIAAAAAASQSGPSEPTGRVAGPRLSTAEPRRWQALLSAAGVGLRQLAWECRLCVLVTNQVRSRVPRRVNGAGLVADPLVRLRPAQARVHAGSCAAPEVPALGLRWALTPHARVFLRKLPPPPPGTGFASSRELTLVSSPAAAPATVEFAITAEGVWSAAV